MFRAVRPLVLALLLGMGCVCAAAAQDLGGEAEVAYREALAEYEALVEELDRSFNRWEQALDVVERSREADDASDRERAFAAFQTVAIRQMGLELEKQDAQQRLNRARAEYLSVLEERENQLLDALAEPELTPARQTAIEDEWQRIRREMVEIGSPAETESRVALRPVPELRVEPTDGPIELREKADFMREHALSYDSIIGDLDREIEGLEERERRFRGLQDLQRDLSRFGQGNLVGAPRTAPAEPDPERTADGAELPAEGQGPAAALASLPLSDQIELLRGTRELAVQYREEALAMADVFSTRAEELGP